MVNGIPEGFGTVTPYLRVRGAAGAVEFYKKAFGAEEVFRLPGPGGMVMHAELKIGSSRVMLSDECEQWGVRSPVALGGTPVTLHMYVADAEAVVRRAAEAGCKVEMPVQLMPWGDRFGKVKDPYGHEWSVATHVEDVPAEEVVRRMEKMSCGEGKKKG